MIVERGRMLLDIIIYYLSDLRCVDLHFLFSSTIEILDNHVHSRELPSWVGYSARQLSISGL